MPIKETFKEKLREESIWIAMLIIFGATFIFGILVLAKEAGYYFNGERARAHLIDNGEKLEYTIDGETYRIRCGGLFVSKADTMTVYYYKGHEGEAIVMSNFEWWALSFFIPLLVIVLSVVNLYKGLRKSKMIRYQFDYQKRKLSSEELGAILYDNFVTHQKNLFERHIENEEYEIIKKQKGFSESENEIISEQEKIWKVGSVYLGIVKNYRENNEYCVKVFFTEAVRYLKDPYAFVDCVEKGIGDDIYEANAVVDKKMTGHIMAGNKFFWIVGKPGLVKNCVLLPEWYYMSEELESM